MPLCGGGVFNAVAQRQAKQIWMSSGEWTSEEPCGYRKQEMLCLAQNVGTCRRNDGRVWRHNVCSLYTLAGSYGHGRLFIGRPRPALSISYQFEAFQCWPRLSARRVIAGHGSRTRSPNCCNIVERQ